MIRFLGTRGTLPVSGSRYVKYGGNTPCLTAPVGDDRCIVIDGGTGLFQLNTHQNFKEYHIFLTHLHWDHIAGLPIFTPFYNENKTIFLYLEDKSTLHSKDFLKVLFNPPFFPIPRSMLKATIRINLIRGGHCFQFGNVKITSAEGNHPNGSLMYKIDDGERVTLFATDYEHGTDVDDFLVEFAYKCNNFIFDTTYLPEDYEGNRDGIPKEGWGHSTYVQGAEFAKRAKVENLILYHHNPDYDDVLLDEMNIRAKREFSSVICSRDGMVIR
ncbi:MBL fold metallo-hydrolase [Limisalsivibrio acetivorans]|uniref:MBL fold metallo-hydrolase n=1 Tax=Limisalsivibrio acetivorans TaxID=1304888 RepID=UPI0003B3D6D9|nr:MBL fold metallo-hydrolase [Limisalsivibrio acetivorans]